MEPSNGQFERKQKERKLASVSDNILGPNIKRWLNTSKEVAKPTNDGDTAKPYEGSTLDTPKE
jgi:hypothetical protein